MPEQLAHIWSWIQANPWTTVAIVAYLLVNLAPRPHPEQHTGWARTFWLIVDRISVFTAGSVPGKLKMLFADSPSSEVAKPSAKDVASAVVKAKKKSKAKPKVEKAEPEKAEEPKKDDEPDVEVDGPGSEENQGKDGSST